MVDDDDPESALNLPRMKFSKRTSQVAPPLDVIANARFHGTSTGLRVMKPSHGHFYFATTIAVASTSMIISENASAATATGRVVELGTQIAI